MGRALKIIPVSHSVCFNFLPYHLILTNVLLIKLLIPARDFTLSEMGESALVRTQPTQAHYVSTSLLKSSVFILTLVVLYIRLRTVLSPCLITTLITSLCLPYDCEDTNGRFYWWCISTCSNTA